MNAYSPESLIALTVMVGMACYFGWQFLNRPSLSFIFIKREILSFFLSFSVILHNPKFVIPFYALFFVRLMAKLPLWFEYQRALNDSFLGSFLITAFFENKINPFAHGIVANFTSLDQAYSFPSHGLFFAQPFVIWPIVTLLLLRFLVGKMMNEKRWSITHIFSAYVWLFGLYVTYIFLQASLVLNIGLHSTNLFMLLLTGESWFFQLLIWGVIAVLHTIFLILTFYFSLTTTPYRKRNVTQLLAKTPYYLVTIITGYLGLLLIEVVSWIYYSNIPVAVGGIPGLMTEVVISLLLFGVGLLFTIRMTQITLGIKLTERLA